MNIAAGNIVQTHLAHTLEALAFIVGTLGVAAAFDIRERRRATCATRPAKTPGPLLTWAVRTSAVGAIGASAIHFRVMPEHFGEAFIYGLFFLVVASTQLAWALLMIVRPHRVLFAAGVAGNAAVVLLWLVTRTIAIPLGPDAGSTEGVGALDVVASTSELICVVAGVLAFRSRRTAAADLSDGDGAIGAPASDNSYVAVG